MGAIREWSACKTPHTRPADVGVLGYAPMPCTKPHTPPVNGGCVALRTQHKRPAESSMPHSPIPLLPQFEPWMISRGWPVRRSGPSVHRNLGAAHRRRLIRAKETDHLGDLAGRNPERVVGVRLRGPVGGG